MKRHFIVPLAVALLVAPAMAETSPATMPDLHSMLMKKFDAMNTMQAGIFHEDITPALAPFFPVGQPIEETRRIVADQRLGKLTPFKGTNDAGMGTMLVTKFDLTSHVFSHVYVVLDFDFEGAEPDMKLQQMKAFLRASNM